MSSIHHRSEIISPLIVPVVIVIIVLTLLPADIAVLLVGVLTATVTIIAYQLKNYLITVLSTAFLLRLGIIFADHTLEILPIPPTAPGNNQLAIEISTAWSNGHVIEVIGYGFVHRSLAAQIVAPFYLILGSSPLAGRVGITFITLLVGYLIFRLARHTLDRRTSTLAAGVVLFWPTIIYRSVVFQREMVIVVALLALLWAAVQWLDSLGLFSVTIAALSTLIIYRQRPENLLLVAVVVGSVCMIKSRDRPHYLGGIALFVMPFVTFFALNFQQFTGVGSVISPAALDSYAHARAHGDAAYLVGLHYETWIDVVLYAPIKILYYLFTPFPWQIRGITELIVGITAISLLIATVFVRRGVGMLQNNRDYLIVLLSYLVTGVVTYAIIEMNYGAAVRRRIQFVPILLLLAVIGLSKTSLDIRWKR
jgi:hypothetical protein